MCPGLWLSRLNQVCCYELSHSRVVFLEAFTPFICDASFSSLCCPDSELQEGERPLSLLSVLFQTPLTVSASSLTPRHWGEGVTSFTANRRKFPGLVCKVQISNVAPMSTVFLMQWLSFSMLPVAYAQQGTSLLTSFLMVGPWLAWWGCGTGGVVWRVIDGLGFIRQCHFQIFFGLKNILMKELCVLKAVVWVFMYRSHWPVFATSRRGRSGGPVSDQSELEQ